MALLVKCRAQYFTETAFQMRGVDYDATHLVKAVKGLSLAPRAWTAVTVRGANLRIREANKDEALVWLAEWAAPLVVAHGAPLTLVPVPSSKTVGNSPPTFRTAIIAQAIANLCGIGVTMAPLLRQRVAVPSTREGGSRDAAVIYRNLEWIAKPSGRVVLIDDVFTGGGHLKAAAWCLMDEGITPSLAICCGRTTHAQLPDPFAVADEAIDLSGKP